MEFRRVLFRSLDVFLRKIHRRRRPHLRRSHPGSPPWHPRPLRCQNHRRRRHVRPPRWHRLPHPSRHALRRHHQRRRFPDRHPRRRLRRHHHHRRFRHPTARHPHARRSRHLVEEGRGQGLHRLRPPHDRHRSRRLRPGRHGRPRGRRRGQLQALHGLSQRPHGGRRHHL